MILNQKSEQEITQYPVKGKPLKRGGVNFSSQAQKVSILSPAYL
jgi:hypothetical protein